MAEQSSPAKDSRRQRRKAALHHLRHVLRKRAAPYEGFDLARATRLGGVLWLVGGGSLALLLPLAPPTDAIGPPGWIVAGVIGAGTVAAAIRMLVLGDRIRTGELLAMSYVAVTMIAVLEWLAGGHSSPYKHLYLLSVLYTSCVHPPRRVIAYLGFFTVAVFASFTYTGWDPNEVADAIIQLLLALGLAALAVVLMEGVRAQRTELRHQGDDARRLAETDSLTGLRNRRGLVNDLERRVERLSSERPLGLILFDLDGFKAYNDTFGHPAGDALLVRLATNLASVVGRDASAYRMGGDEFCVLARGDERQVRAAAAAASAALSEEGEGFRIGASCGVTFLPTDTRDAAEALRMADRRMYASKNRTRGSAGRQTTDVLLTVLSERNPELAIHLNDVTELCDAVATRLGLAQEQRVPLLQAASLHDVGKAAIPDAILGKPAPLSRDEWAFMRRHTLIGERILSAAPSLVEAAKIVRSSHERFDGSGYPDGLAGAEIPLGARVVAVCDAYDAMTSDRPYRAARTSEEALEELRRCAGSQFDPDVVDAFCLALATLKDGFASAEPARQSPVSASAAT